MPFRSYFFQSTVSHTDVPSRLRGEQGSEVFSERRVSYTSDPESGAGATDSQNHGRSVLRGDEFAAGHHGAVRVVVKVHPEQVQGSGQNLDTGRARKLRSTTFWGTQGGTETEEPNGRRVGTMDY